VNTGGPFLSDGAFEEQRGVTGSAAGWASDDCGLAMPIMINNGRRIDQRSTLALKAALPGL